MEKIYKKIGWENSPKTTTPLGARNLRKMDDALDEIDNRTIEMNESIATNRRNIEGLYSTVNAHTSAIEGLTEKSNDIDMLKIVSTASGSPAYMADASNMNIEGIDFYGESKQLQTTGAQMADIADFELVKPDTRVKTFSIDTVEAGSYNLNVKLKGTATQVRVRFVGVDNTNYKDVLLKDGNTVLTCDGQANKLYFFIVQEQADGVTASISDVMLSVEPLPYEPYTNGKASPSPDYPQPIESKVVNRVDVYGKNLLENTGNDIERIGLTYTMQSDGSVKVVGTTTEADYQVLIGQVTLPKGSYILNGAPNNICRLRIAKGTNSTLLGHDLGSGFSFILEEESTVFVSVRTQSTVGTSINAVYYPMIRLATFTDATYEPYKSQTVNLPEPIELNGMNGVRDTDRLKKFGVVVFDGSEDWIKHDEQYPHLFRTYLQTSAKGLKSVLCSHFPYDAGNLMGGLDGCRFRNEEISVVFYISSSKHTDVSAFKSWLASHPVTLVYELAEPIETALSQADIDAIKQLHTYKPNTIVMNDADAEMNVHYVADTKTYIDKKFEALASALVNQ